MVFGLSLSAYTQFHTILSLIGIATGIVWLLGLLGGKQFKGWTEIFLFTTILTSVTGYGFPATQVLPSHIVGGISLVVLAVALFALYGKHLSGAWRWIYVAAATIALYLNCFVGVVQAFLKIPAVHALAPTQGEPPFAIAQAIVLGVFAVLGFIAARKFRPQVLAA